MEMLREVLKWCNQCQQYHPLSEFYHDKSTKDKLTNRCKGCCRRYYNDNIENIKKRNRYNIAHKK